MPKKYPPFEEVKTSLANAIADMIEHPDCYPSIYNDLTGLVENWENNYSDVIVPAEEARRIRKTLPKLLDGGRWRVEE